MFNTVLKGKKKKKTKQLAKAFLISSTSNTVYGPQLSTPPLSLNLLYLCLQQSPIWSNLEHLSYQIFVFLSRNVWSCSPSRTALLLHCFLPFTFTKHNKKLCRRDRGYSLRGSSPAVPESALQYFRLAGQEGELHSWSVLLCQTQLCWPCQVTVGCLRESLSRNISLIAWTWVSGGSQTSFIQHI